MQELHKEETPANGGWMFRQPQTGFKIDRPESVSWTFDRAVEEIIKHRFKNPAAVAKHGLSTNAAVVGDELMQFNRLRLGIPDPVVQTSFFQPSRSLSEHVVAAAVNIKRAAQGTAVVLDWLSSGGKPVAPELSEKRASICAACPQNKTGDWFTVAPAEIIKGTIETWRTLTGNKEFKFSTSYDEQLKSCAACKCLLNLKVFVDSRHILSRTKPDVFNDLDPRCWILAERKAASDSTKVGI